ncbi:DUF2155 domain-containing protein [Asaia lannensis]|uniref:DUF2155 domain-containing protein n=1 Tax=Asaia lannensis NBRC 102526 TaxID=1307926 RepID=A0ABT1CHB1_9PROT|nr:DUF2155 domain-containing protein [Asaia lannensis]MCO6160268.1 DUF2155 domain-containing protein [Asaia lannensis NBRC 102526]GBQ94806.1 hypothetical protein AA102526_0217 [Asaia lannensis NBRC 102526]
MTSFLARPRSRLTTGALLSHGTLLLCGTLAFAAPSFSPVAHAAEAIAPPVMYPATLWQGRGEAIIRVLNRTDSHIETLTIPVGGQAQYRSLHLQVTRCVDRPETLPRDAAALVTTSDETDPDARFTGWILAEEPSLNAYKSALYGLAVVACSGPKADPAVAPLPQPVVPVLSSATPEGAQNQPGDLDDPSHAATPQTLPGSMPTGRSGNASPTTGGPTRLAPLGDPSGASRPMNALPRQTASGTTRDDQGGPTQLAPLSGGPVSNGPVSGGNGQALPPPQPYGQ